MHTKERAWGAVVQWLSSWPPMQKVSGSIPTMVTIMYVLSESQLSPQTTPPYQSVIGYLPGGNG